MTGEIIHDNRFRNKIYHVDYGKRVARYALLGLTEAEAIGLLNITRRTWLEWRKAHHEFARAWDAGAEEADGRVAAALHKRACGFTKRGLRKPMNTKFGIVVVDYEEYFPPDVTAGLAWLKVRQPEKWGAVSHDKPKGLDKLPDGVSLYIDADTFALTGLAPPEMKDVTPAQ